MSANTAIEWTDATWNPVTGCTRLSEGCRNCYAEVMAARFNKPGQWGEGLAQIVQTPQGKDHRWTGQVRFNEQALLAPLRWKKPRRIFVCSTSDLFQDAVPDEWIDRVFAVMALAPQHTFQVLTKRAGRMREYMDLAVGRIADQIMVLRKTDIAVRAGMGPSAVAPLPHIRPGAAWWPLANVWLGVSVEDQAAADTRIPVLLATPAAKRFLSCEPLLGPMQLGNIDCQRLGLGFYWINALTGAHDDMTRPCAPVPKLDWVIVGGESGPGARPMHPDWARSLRDQCAAAGVPFFMKQLSGPGGRAVKDIALFPEDLQIREFPA